MAHFTDEYLKIPENHWWYVTRNEIIYLLIVKYSNSDNPCVIDVGCGCGFLVKYLHKKGIKVKGVDSNRSFVEYAAKLGVDIDVGDIEKGIKTYNKYDVVILSDVVEHTDTPNTIIRNALLLLKENGICIVFVPAFMFLWSWHDVINFHKKRYTLCELERLLVSQGLDVVFSSYWNFFSFFPTFIVRIFKKVLGIKTPDFYSFSPFLNSFIIFLLRFENLLIKKGFKMPFGVSAFCVGVKNQ
ncbi:MAG: class I SAM-dependent methyltransferase [Elusimicrobiales bacterium]